MLGRGCPLGPRATLISWVPRRGCGGALAAAASRRCARLWLWPLQAGLRAELNKVHEATRKEATPAERTAERRAAALARSRRAAAFAPKAHKGEREELL